MIMFPMYRVIPYASEKCCYLVELINMQIETFLIEVTSFADVLDKCSADGGEDFSQRKSIELRRKTFE